MESSPEPAPGDADDAVVSVTVERSGGFAGLTRRWGVRAPAPDAQRWVALIDACPWNQQGDTGQPSRQRQTNDPHTRTADPPDGADRFSWSLCATVPDAPADYRAELTETQASGAWRTLIDAVRDAGGTAR